MFRLSKKKKKKNCPRTLKKKWIFVRIQKYIKQKLQQFKKTVFNSAKKKKYIYIVIERKITQKNGVVTMEKNINSKVHREKFSKQSFSNNDTRSFIIICTYNSSKNSKF